MANSACAPVRARAKKRVDVRSVVNMISRVSCRREGIERLESFKMWTTRKERGGLKLFDHAGLLISNGNR